MVNVTNTIALRRVFSLAGTVIAALCVVQIIASNVSAKGANYYHCLRDSHADYTGILALHPPDLCK